MQLKALVLAAVAVNAANEAPTLQLRLQDASRPHGAFATMFPAPARMTATITIPPRTKFIGEAWPQFMAYGSKSQGAKYWSRASYVSRKATCLLTFRHTGILFCLHLLVC